MCNKLNKTNKSNKPSNSDASTKPSKPVAPLAPAKPSVVSETKREVKVNSPLLAVNKNIKPKGVKRVSFRYGRIKTIQDGIVIATGLKFVKSGEVVYFIDSVTKKQINIRGLVLNLNNKTVHIILLGNERLLKVGDFIIHRNNLLKLATTLGLFGNVNPPFGMIIDAVKSGDGVDLSGKYMERLDVIEKKAVGIIGRTPVNFPLRTGIKAIDSLTNRLWTT